jgi:hypothetical protein
VSIRVSRFLEHRRYLRKYITGLGRLESVWITELFRVNVQSEEVFMDYFCT